MAHRKVIEMFDTTDYEQEVWDLSLEWPSESDDPGDLVGLSVITIEEMERWSF